MNARIGRRAAGDVALAILLVTAACREENKPVPRPPGATREQTPKPPDSSGAAGPKQMEDIDTSGVTFADARLTLTGISFSIPQGWVRQDPGMNPQSPGLSRKAQFRLPKADNQAEDAGVAITHFPNMKGMDEANLQRWYGQFVQPDGRPTVEVATHANYQIGEVSVTLVDIAGTMKAGPPMMGSGRTQENYRMLGAIINHAKGPHFVKVTGPAPVVERWKPSVAAFLKSVKVNR